MMPLPEASVLVMPIHCRKLLGVFDWTPDLALGRGRWDGKTSGKILPAHVYRKEEE
jgi:hypothetical protein